MALLGGYRLRRGPALVLLALVGVVGTALILATQLRPSLDIYAPITIDAASVGVTYAVDGQLCVRGRQVGARLDRVEVDDSTGLALRVVLPPAGTPPVVAFPVEPSAARPVSGAVVPARDDLCLRLLVSSTRQGTFRAQPVSVKVRYGPFGLFRRSLDVRPPTTLQVVRTGPDPRLAGG